MIKLFILNVLTCLIGRKCVLSDVNKFSVELCLNDPYKLLMFVIPDETGPRRALIVGSLRSTLAKELVFE